MRITRSRAVTLNEHTGAQVRRLCAVLGLAEQADEVAAVLADIIGPAGARALDEPPLWRSDVADDHTPVEYSVAFEQDGSHTLRLLVESVARRPGPSANLDAALSCLDRLAERYPLALDRFEAVRGLFLPDEPRGVFSLWFSVVVTRARVAVKVYLNPQVHGQAAAPGLVAAGLDRLGLTAAWPDLSSHAPRPTSTLDRFSFFAIDLDDTPRSRVKVYQSHFRAGLRELAHLGAACPLTDHDVLADFESTIGGLDSYDGRPLVTSYIYLAGQREPSGFSVYLPVRDYVPDDAVALTRTKTLLSGHGFDAAVLDRAIAAVTNRPLESGVGLIAHVSLRMGRPRPGITVYLSAEAYAVAAPGGVAAGAA
ncbi:DMATS type aromatic prenyltransferase [Actinokineospora cianjurensis]|uniref:DMATS type aromatic prenyltransferase n=1 Tax=Actinokineospora cianjurensis TaxID=585224 RepID=A0A421AW17_9PSEU|nr:DMATS type aromatic prenyltransferase [Actinokineospora cianjurensis]